MVTSVNAGSRLDRLPIGPFHRRIMLLIGIGMFFDGFDIYLAGTVLGVSLTAHEWAQMTGPILIGLIPFAALGIVAGQTNAALAWTFTSNCSTCLLSNQ